MNPGIKTIVYPVKDPACAKAFYSALLGVEPYHENPHYVGFKVGDQELGLIPNGHGRGMTGAVGYCTVADIRKSLDSLVVAGATRQQDVTEVGGGRLIASVKDADGNVVGLLQEP